MKKAVLIKCPKCGESSYEKKDETICTCNICGSDFLIINSEISSKLYHARRAQQDLKDFITAEKLFNSIKKESKNDEKLQLECELGLLLSKFGVFYLKDFDDSLIPIISKYYLGTDSITSSEHYKNIINNRYGYIYKNILEELEIAYKEIKKEDDKFKHNVKPYDVFICTKMSTKDYDNPNADENVIPKDYDEAKTIYEELKKKELNVFLSKKTLSGKISWSQIFAALRNSKSFLLISSCKKYLESPFVSLEWGMWNKFVNDKIKEDKNFFFYTCSNINESNIPLELHNVQRDNQQVEVINRIFSLLQKDEDDFSIKQWKYQSPNLINFEKYIDDVNSNIKRFSLISENNVVQNRNYEQDLENYINKLNNGDFKYIEKIINLGIELYRNQNIPYIKDKRINLSKNCFYKLLKSCTNLAKLNSNINQDLIALGDLISTYEDLPFTKDERIKLVEKCYHVLADQNDTMALYKLGELHENDIDRSLDYYSRALENKSEAAIAKLSLLADNYFYGKTVEQDYKKALKIYLMIEKYSDDACCQIGKIYKNGLGIKENTNLALEWFEKAVSKHNLNAYYEIGDMYLNGIGVSKDYEEALKWFNLSIDYPMSKYSIGNMYYNGIGVKPNKKEAIKWYTLSANQGYLYAQYILGKCYELGDDVVKNYNEAIKWYKLAAENGHVDAKIKIANYYFDSNDEIKQSEAYKIYEELSKIKCLDAQLGLAHCYYYGKGIEKDCQKAFVMYKNLSDLGIVDAQLGLANCYYDGNGVNENCKEAFELYKIASERGNINAQLGLANCYYFGYGVNKNFEEAFKLYKNVAEQGNSEAQRMLAHCYYYGEGVEKDIEQFEKWIKLSVEQNNLSALVSLGSFYAYSSDKEISELGVKYLEEAVEKGDNEAALILAEMYMYGEGNIEQNTEKAINVCEIAIKNGDGNATLFLANMYFSGDVIEQDYDKAFSLYKITIDSGYLGSFIETSHFADVGYLYLHGYGTEKNLEEALKYYKLARGDGFKYSVEIGSIYYELKDYQNAELFYEEAVKKGYDESSYRHLARFYYEGTYFHKGVKKDIEIYEQTIKDMNIEKAIKLYENGIKHNDYQCLIELANIYINEFNNFKKAVPLVDKYINKTENKAFKAFIYDKLLDKIGIWYYKRLFFPNYKKAFYYLNLVQTSGPFFSRSFQAFYILGELYYWGLGTKRDHKKAYELYMEIVRSRPDDTETSLLYMDIKYSLDRLDKALYGDDYNIYKDKKRWSKIYKKAYKALNRRPLKKFKTTKQE